MKIKRLSTYNAFVNAGRPYYPVIRDGVLLIANFSINAQKSASHHKKCLILDSHVVYNARGLVAIYHEWWSRYGYRDRWFYYRDGKKVTFNALTWDERIRLCYRFESWRYGVANSFNPSYPCKRWRSYASMIGLL
jgi:hypothetical protein